jgi:hypothetical protein
MATHGQVRGGVAKWTIWWLEERKKKLREHLSDTMAVNPFLLPILFDLHNITQFDQLNELLIGSHLVTGHNTGFGKLVDEKILPNVFGTQKLDSSFRKSHKPFNQACFDEIDQVVVRKDSKPDLLSLKASRWTIQLTMAVQLNKAFEEILDEHGDSFSDVVVGVYYGKNDNLTDKYDILRGINRGKKHDVKDLTSRVKVYAGRDFWEWLNAGESKTQDWVLEGIQSGLIQDDSRAECGKLLDAFKEKIVKTYSAYVQKDGTIDWSKLLKDING